MGVLAAQLRRAGLTAVEKVCLRTWALGGWWDQSRLHQCGLASSGVCPACGKEEASWEHVVWRCPVLD
eukprot:2137559-Lingulodinium_polyedra.AAC.1